MGESKEEGTRLFSVVSSNRTRQKGHKLKDIKFHLNTEITFFCERVVKQWSRFPRDAVESPSSEIFKAK